MKLIREKRSLHSFKGLFDEVKCFSTLFQFILERLQIKIFEGFLRNSDIFLKKLVSVIFKYKFSGSPPESKVFFKTRSERSVEV